MERERDTEGERAGDKEKEWEIKEGKSESVRDKRGKEYDSER